MQLSRSASPSGSKRGSPNESAHGAEQADIENDVVNYFSAGQGNGEMDDRDAELVRRLTGRL